MGLLTNPNALAAPAEPVSSPVVEISADIARRGAKIAPLVLLFGAFWGVDGIIAAACGLAVVIINFALTAVMMNWASKISFAAVAGVALFGYLIRLGIITAAILLLKDRSWIAPLSLGLTLIICHLGLLIWETRFVSASLAYPGLKPKPSASQTPA